MDLAFSPEDLAFQREVRAFITEAFDDDMRARSAQSKTGGIGADHIRFPVAIGGAAELPQRASIRRE